MKTVKPIIIRSLLPFSLVHTVCALDNGQAIVTAHLEYKYSSIYMLLRCASPVYTVYRPFPSPAV